MVLLQKGLQCPTEQIELSHAKVDKNENKHMESLGVKDNSMLTYIEIFWTRSITQKLKEHVGTVN